MYLRERRRRNGDGSEISHGAPTHSERHPVTGSPVAKVIHCDVALTVITGRV